MFSFVVQRKKLTRFIGAFLFLIIAASGIVYVSIQPQQANTEPVNHFQVVVDAGHGGVDGGAVGYNGTIEKDVNLQIALKVREMLLITGTDVVMTREIDESIHNDDANTVRAKKRSDLENRLEIIETNPNSVTVSIHQNINGQSSLQGLQLYYAPTNPNSYALAEIVKNQFIEKINGENRREIKPAGSNLYLMYNAETPMVLVECGFLSNPEEEQRLTTDEYQNQLAFTITAAIIQYRQENSV